MIPSPFEYVKARSVDEALDALAEHGEDAKLLAGGHSLLPIMKLRLADPGRADRHQRHPRPVLRPGGRGSDAGRHRGGHPAPRAASGTTVAARRGAAAAARRRAGSGTPRCATAAPSAARVAHSDPASDLPTALLALGGTVVLQGPEWSPRGAGDGVLDRLLRDGDVAGRAGRRAAGAAHRRRGLGVREVHPAGERLADRGCRGRGRPRRTGQHGRRGASGPRPRRRHWRGGASIAEAAELADQGTSPVADMHADQDYRRHLARLLTRRALESAAGA